MSGNQAGFLLKPEARQLLQTYDIAYPSHGVAHSAEEAARVADGVGYPVVLKVVPRDVVHKSDAGEVAVGLKNAGSVHDAYEQIVRSVEDCASGAEIRGVIVCEQASPGLEVIVGGLKDALYGPTVMFGLGGIFVEVLKDVSFRAPPLEWRDAEEMVREIQGYPLLKGVRGHEGCDIDALADLLGKVSRLMMEWPDIQELDMNPVRVYEQGLLTLDVRVLTGC